MKNILLIGKMGCGKGVITEILCQQYGYTNYSFASWLKNTVKKHYGLTAPQKGDIINIKGKDLTYRTVLQLFGTEVIRAFDPNWHVQEVMNQIDKVPFVIDDVRFYNEIEALGDEYNAITVKVECNESKRIQRICQRDSLCPDEQMNSHRSETELNGYIPDYVMDNSGSKNELLVNVKQLISRLGVIK